ncbi:MAG: hypothetical protein KatS3mg102_2328 [Planctomycetota bacterium]|nr:MAG: hypothetical protein KatS3mg102_2328 [Planctomycetota bacterium]
MDDWRRGELARRAGVHAETVRYYERRGLLPRPRRSTGGHRLYGEPELRRLRFIKAAQQLGFTLAEVRELLRLRLSESARCAEVKRRARSRLVEIERRVQALEARRRALERLLRACEEARPASDCPILAAIEQGAVPPAGAQGQAQAGCACRAAARGDARVKHDNPDEEEP